MSPIEKKTIGIGIGIGNATAANRAGRSRRGLLIKTAAAWALLCIAGIAVAHRVASLAQWTGAVGTGNVGGGNASTSALGGSGFTVNASVNANNFIGMGTSTTATTLSTTLAAAQAGALATWYTPNIDPATSYGFNVSVVGTDDWDSGTGAGGPISGACRHAANSPIGSVLTCHGTSVLTITFEHPVSNPTLHISRLGGNYVNNPSTTDFNVYSTYQITTPGATLALLSSNGQLAVTGGNTIGHAATGATASLMNTSCTAAGTPTACGSVRVNGGPYSSLTFTASLKVVRRTGTDQQDPDATATYFDGVHWIVTLPEDYGDAPASYDPAAAASHILTDLKLGPGVTEDAATTRNPTNPTGPVYVAPSPIANATASGDGSDDGATFPAAISTVTGNTTTVPVTLSGASKAGVVCGWIDFNRDGDFDAGERSTCQTFASGATSASLVFATPAGAAAGASFARVRASYDSSFTTAAASATGALDSGEVEDFAVTLTTPQVRVAKTAQGGGGVSFNFSTGNTATQPGAIAIPAGGGTVTGAPVVISSPGTDLTVTEAVPPAGWILTAIDCVNNGTGVPAFNPSYDLANRTATVPAASLSPSADIVCTFTNAKQPILRLNKSLPSGRFVASDQFTLQIAGTGGPASATTTGAGGVATGTATLNPATVGSAYTLSETAAAGANLANYATVYSCTNTLSGGQTPSGSGTSFSLTAAAGDDVTCTFANTRNPLADLQITKTNTPASGPNDLPGDAWMPGASVSYSIVVNNAGPDAANNAVLRDPAPAGLSCSTVSCGSQSGGAVCPTAPALSLSNLQSSGVPILSMPSGGSLTFTVDCVVQ